LLRGIVLRLRLRGMVLRLRGILPFFFFLLRLRGIGVLRLGGGGAEARRLRGRVVVLRLQEILGWCCWGMGVGCCG
jgi:hypothetical protein